MKYVALLRGINVGGNRKVPMSDLKATFERAGMSDVTTYINSGNVIFTTRATDVARISSVIEKAIESEYGFPVMVLLRDADEMRTLARELGDRANDASTKCDVLLLAPEIDSPDVLDQLVIKADIDQVRYVPGAVLWHVDRHLVTRSGLVRVVGTDLYARITVRNCNTIRKLAEMMN